MEVTYLQRRHFFLDSSIIMPNFSKHAAVLLLFLLSFAISSRAGISIQQQVSMDNFLPLLADCQELLENKGFCELLQPRHELLYQISSPNREDRPVILDCEAKGDPVPEYRWTKNGQEFSTSGSDDRVAQEPGKGTLTIHRPRDIDEGLYQCRAENSYGISLSNAVYLRRAGLDTFRSENMVEDMEVNEGQQLTIKCHPPSGNPPPNIFWILQSPNGAMTTVNGSRVSVDPEGDLHFSNVTLQDASGDNSYACSAYSPFLREYKTGELKKLIVRPSGSAAPNKVPPVCQFTSPKHMTGMRGQSIEISCIYGGTPLPQIRWERKNAPLPPRRHFLTDFGKVLRIEKLDFDDRGTYECVASNGAGQVGTHAFTLTIESTPFWIVEPEPAVKAEDEDHTFSCVAGGVPEPKIQWFVNGTPIENLAPVSNRIINGNNITLTRVQKDIDTDNYQCNASNVHGYTFADVYMNVLAVPADIVEPPADLSEAVDGATATITCRVYGAPHPRVGWEKDGQTINVQPGSGARYEIKRNGDLIISDATSTDSGNYTCIATNRFGDKKASGQLIIRRRTEITAPPEDLQRRAGESATFRCSATSDMNLEYKIEWTRDDEPIKLGENGRIFQLNDNSLTISQAQEVHSGVYKCIARTKLDAAEASATLLVRDVPNPPINVRVQCSPKTAIVSWEPNGDNRDPIFEFIIQYTTTFQPGVWDDIKTDIPSSDLSTSVDLSPWVNYTFQVRARNKVGISNASAPSEEVCTTPPDIPYKNPDNVQGRGDKPDNLVISWTPMPQIDHNGPGFHYEVKFMDTSPDPTAQKVEHMIPVTNWRQGSVTIANQPTYVPFDVRVIAVNDEGRSKDGDPKPVAGFSGEDLPTESPKNFYVTKLVDGKSADVEWRPVAADSVRGEFKGYKIQVLPEGETEPREIRVGPNATTATIDVLKPASSNTVKILPYNGQYDGPPSEALVVITPEAPPGRAADFKAYPMGRSAIFLEWEPPTEPNGRLLNYEIELYEADGLNVRGPVRPPIIVPIGDEKLKLTGLKPETTYRIYHYATNLAGRGEPGIVEAATDANRTHEAMALLPPPGAPEFLVAGKTNESLIIAWQPSSAAGLGHRTGEHFYVEHKREGDGEWAKTDEQLDGLQQEIFGLEPGTTYDVRVVAVEGMQETRGPVRKETTLGERAGEVAPGPYAYLSSAWFIAIMVLVALLILLFIILLCCLFCRKRRGGKYAVNEGDRERGKPPPYEYEKAPLRPLETNNLPKIRPSDGIVNGDENASIISREGGSEADSMEEYADPNDPKMFSEDGSWIGQYASTTVRSNDAVVTTTVQPPSGSTFV